MEQRKTQNLSIDNLPRSFFQSLCIFGYCLFPLTMAAIATLFWGNLLFRLILSVVATVWSSLGK